MKRLFAVLSLCILGGLALAGCTTDCTQSPEYQNLRAANEDMSQAIEEKQASLTECADSVTGFETQIAQLENEKSDLQTRVDYIQNELDVCRMNQPANETVMNETES